jgi:hypothetical protein
MDAFKWGISLDWRIVPSFLVVIFPSRQAAHLGIVQLEEPSCFVEILFPLMSSCRWCIPIWPVLVWRRSSSFSGPVRLLLSGRVKLL